MKVEYYFWITTATKERAITKITHTLKGAYIESSYPSETHPKLWKHKFELEEVYATLNRLNAVKINNLNTYNLLYE